MKSILVKIDGKTYKCQYFFDTESSTGGIDVSYFGKHLGEMWGWELPDESIPSEVGAFKEDLNKWLTDNSLI